MKQVIRKIGNHLAVKGLMRLEISNAQVKTCISVYTVLTVYSCKNKQYISRFSDI